MHDLRNSLFYGFENVRGRFVYDVASVHEIEYPFRKCDKALYIHILPGKALVLGKWKEGEELEQHLLEAMRGRVHVQAEEFRNIASQIRFDL
jgi:hypothetical protein